MEQQYSSRQKCFQECFQIKLQLGFAISAEARMTMDDLEFRLRLVFDSNRG